jgi:hypothetical protein
MTKEEYLSRNRLGFEGDLYIKQEIEKLILKFDIENVIETGTFMGSTAKVLSTMVKNVYTIELNDEHYNESNAYLKDLSNVKIIKGDSKEELDKIIPDLKGNTLCYLDAHFYVVCPLMDELKMIAKHKLKPIIVIHDFKVPGKPELGFDAWNNQEFTWEWIKPVIEEIYGVNGYSYYYNSIAEGAKRGVIYIQNTPHEA